MARRTRLLVVTRHNPLPENDGGGSYLHSLLAALAAQGFLIELLWLNADGALTRTGHWKTPPSYKNVARLRVITARPLGSHHFFPATWWLPKKARLLHVTKKTLQFFRLFPSSSPSPIAHRPSPASPTSPLTSETWAALPSPAEEQFFLARLRAFRPDSVLVNYCWLAPLLRHVEGLPTAILTSDVVSQRLKPNPARFPDPGTAYGEATLLRQARHIFAISEDDAAVFRKMLGVHSIKLIPKAALPTPLTASTVAGRILFVGGINDFNRDGLAWFLEKIWPRVLPLAPEAHLHICGGICETVETAPLRVTLRGRVPDLSVEYAAASIVIVPLLNGTGVKIKLVEAASFGKPIVTTSVGLQGLPFFAPTTLCADTAEDFARALLHLLPNQPLQSELSAATLAAVREHLAPAKAYAPAIQALART